MKLTMTFFLLGTMVMALVLLGVSVTRRDTRKSPYLVALSCAILLYLLGFLLEISSTNLEGAKVALIVENAGIPLIGPFFSLFVLKLCGYRLKEPLLPALAVVYGFIFFCVVLFNDYHHLYYFDIVFVQDAQFYSLIVGKGPLYVIQHSVEIVVMLIAYVALAIRYWQWPSHMRRQMTLIVVAALLPTLTYLFYLSGLTVHVDATPFMGAFSLLFFNISILRNKLLDMVPMATEVAVETMDDAVMIIDRSGRVLSINHAAHKLFPGLEKLLEFELISDLPDWPRELAKICKPDEINFQLKTADGSLCHCRAKISAVGYKDGNANFTHGWSLIIRDITETVQLMKQLEVFATTDSLTGIYNRRHFIELAERQLEIAKRQPQKISILMFDLDHFKRVNDVYGHMAGDRVLAAIADKVRGQLRPYDIFARYGGEEFIILVSMCLKDAEELAWRLCLSIEKNVFEFDGELISITASFGVAEIPPASDLNAAMVAADSALYAAKNAGRNRVVTIHSL